MSEASEASEAADKPKGIDWDALKVPFLESEIEWRVGQHTKNKDKATVLPYITARAVMDRLDQVFTPAGWRAFYEHVLVTVEEKGKAKQVSGFICSLEVWANGMWVGKSDAADVTDIEPIKGGISGALKRAAVHWGIGRYLYDLEDFGYLEIKTGWPPKGTTVVKTKKGIGDAAEFGYIIPPRLPDSALPPTAQHKQKPEGKGKPKETEEEKAQRQAEHHPSWPRDQPGFFKALNELAFVGEDGYDEVVRFVLWAHKHKGGKGLRPSRMDSKGRKEFLKFLGSEKGAGVYAEFIDHEYKHGKFVAEGE